MNLSFIYPRSSNLGDDIQTLEPTDQKRIAACKNLLPQGTKVVEDKGYFIIKYKGKAHNSSRSELTALRIFLKYTTEIFCTNEVE